MEAQKEKAAKSLSVSKSAVQIAVSGQKTPYICSFSLSSLGIKSVGFVFLLKLAGFHYNLPVR